MHWRALLLSVVVFGCEEPREPQLAPQASRSGPETAQSVPKQRNTSESVVSAVPAGPCPADMVAVSGRYCEQLSQRCEHWIKKSQGRCGRFSSEVRCLGRERPLEFCIDRYEFPNQRGAIPAVMVSWYEADAMCRSLGKRLCNDSEWTLACEGAARQPYPYGDGMLRDDTACNIDRPYHLPDFDAFSSPRGAASEVARLDQRLASGEMERCKSPAGVHDMTGNVDEWVVNESGKPHVSGLKGGYWGPIRARCRPMTTFHNPPFRFYQIGFRCCRDQGHEDSAR